LRVCRVSGAAVEGRRSGTPLAEPDRMGASGADPSSGFLLTLHVLIWTVLTLGLVALLVIQMIN